MNLLFSCFIIVIIRIKLTGSQNDHDDLLHNTINDDYNYDHTAILGRSEAERFSKMSPEESKEKFSEIIDKMDLSGNGFIEIEEMKKWIKAVFDNILSEDVDGQWADLCPKDKDKIDFKHYVSKTYNERKSPELTKLMSTEERRWLVADLDNDTLLNKSELFRFLHPEEFNDMRSLISLESLEGMDLNNDSVIDINEYLNDLFPEGKEVKEEWIRNERRNFGIDRDLNKDGVMDVEEVQNWLLPETYNRVDAETSHLFNLADVDKDGVLSKLEMLNKYQIFVGSRRDENDLLFNREDL